MKLFKRSSQKQPATQGTKHAAWLVALMISLTVSAWYFASSPPVKHLDDRILSTRSDMIVTQLTVRQFDTKGHLVNFLQTPLLRHIPLNNTHWLKTPHIIISQENQSPWEISAQQATALYGGKEITFNQHVVIHQDAHQNTLSSTLTTEAMTYFPQDKFATTLLKVTYEQPGRIVQSTGMKAFLAEKRVQLLNQARSTYEPTHG